MAAMMIDAHINQETPPPQTIAEQAIEASPETRNDSERLITMSNTSRRRAFSEIAGKVAATVCMRNNLTYLAA